MSDDIHIAITRRVRSGYLADFERLLTDFSSRSLAEPGARGMHFLHPPPGSSSAEYGILHSFASEAERDAFYRSPLYRQWLKDIAPLTEGEAIHRELSGLEAWFRHPGESIPPRWKMALLTWVAVWPVIHLIVTQGSLAFGAFVWGQVTVHSDPGFALWVASCGLLLTLSFSKLLSVNRTMEVDLTPSLHWPEHRLATEPGDDAGPVVITVHYRVAPEMFGQFAEAIAKLRVVRLRDGAYFWALTEDLEAPGSFQEIFHVGSWGEHLRQHQRSTEDDRKVEEAVLACHEGGGPEITHHLMINVRRVRERPQF